jgi:hypothetical protein
MSFVSHLKDNSKNKSATDEQMKSTTSSLRPHIRSRVLFSRRIAAAGVVLCVAAGVLSVPVHNSARGQAGGADVAALQKASQIDIGVFCLKNIPAGSIRVISTDFDNRIWWNVKIKVPSGGGRGARAFIFDKPLPVSQKFQVCSENTVGVSTILAGDLNSAEITARFAPATDTLPPVWQVEANNLNAELGKVTANLDKLYGATLDTQRRLLWVKNPSQLFFTRTNTQREGTLRVETTDVYLRGVRLQLGSGFPEVVADFNAVADPSRDDLGHVKFDIDVANAGIQFVSGEFFSKNISLPLGRLSFGYAFAELKSGTIQRAALTSGDGRVYLTLSGLSLNATELSHTEFPRISVLPGNSIQIKGIKGLIGLSHEAAVLLAPTVLGATTDGATVRILDGQGKVAAQGMGGIEVRSLDVQSADGDVRIAEPAIAALSPIWGTDGVTRLRLSMLGNKDKPNISGDALMKRLAAGALTIDSAGRPFKALIRDGARIEEGMSLPFKISASTPEEHASIAVPGDIGHVVLDGQVAEFAAGGVLTIAGVDLGDSTLRVDPGSFKLQVTGQVAHEPLLFGSVPVFQAGVSLTLSSPGGFVVATSGAKGSVDASTGILILNNASLGFRDPTRPLQISIPIRTSVDTVLAIDLSNLGVTFKEGTVDVSGIKANATSAQPIDVAGIALTSPMVSIDHLRLVAKEGAAAVSATNLSFAASSLEHAGDPYWQAELSQPLTIPTMTAEVTESRGAMLLQHALLTNLQLGASRASFRSRDGVSVAGTNATIKLDKITENAIQGSVAIADGHVALDTRSADSSTSASTAFQNFKVNLDGIKSDLAGDGQIHLSDLSATVHTRLNVGDCSEADRWKIEAGISLGSVDLALKMKNSALTGEAKIDSGHFSAKNDGYSRCEFDKHSVLVKEQSAYFKYPCVKNWHPDMCDGNTIIVPEIAATIHWIAELHELQVSGRMDNVRVSMRGAKGVRVCPGTINLNPPLIVANYHPNFNDDGGVIGRAIRDLIRTIASTFESALANIIGSDVSVLSYLRSALFPNECYGGS